MPKITADVTRLRLFTDDDPLEIDIPGVGEWRLSDYDVNPPSDDGLAKPVTYMVTLLASQAWETEADTEAGLAPNADAMADAIADALAADKLHVSVIGDIIEDVNKARDKARKRALAQTSGRPTKRRSR